MLLFPLLILLLLLFFRSPYSQLSNLLFGYINYKKFALRAQVTSCFIKNYHSRKPSHFFHNWEGPRLEKCYILAHNSLDTNIIQEPNLGHALGRRGCSFSLTFQALQLLTSISTDELHPGDKGLNPGSSNPAIKSPGKNNVLEMQNDTDVEKKEIVPHLKLETMYGQMENKQIQIPTSHHVFYIDISSINWLKTCASKIKL